MASLTYNYIKSIHILNAYSYGESIVFRYLPWTEENVAVVWLGVIIEPLEISGTDRETLKETCNVRKLLLTDIRLSHAHNFLN